MVEDLWHGRQRTDARDAPADAGPGGANNDTLGTVNTAPFATALVSSVTPISSGRSIPSCFLFCRRPPA